MAQLKSTIVNGTLTVTNTFLAEGGISTHSGLFKIANSDDTYSFNIRIDSNNRLAAFYSCNGTPRSFFAYITERFYIYADNLYLGYHNNATHNTLLTFYTKGNFGGGMCWKTQAVTGTDYITKASALNDWAQLYYQNPAQKVSDSTYLTPLLFFRTWSHDGSGNQVNYYETFQLPTVNPNRTSNAAYEILTTKKILTVAQGGTGRTSGGTSSYAKVGNGASSADIYVSSLRANESEVGIWKGSASSAGGPHIDFHYNNQQNFSARIIQYDENTLRIVFPS